MHGDKSVRLTLRAGAGALPLRETLKRYPAAVWAVRRARVAYRFGLRGALRLRRGARIRAYLETHAVRKLQLGALGQPLEGWLNTDVAPVQPGIVYLDATRPFPIPSASFDAVFAEHMLEHISYRDGEHMLRECFRILKPGGRIRIVTPRLEFLFDLLREPLSPVQLAYIRATRSECIPEAHGDEASFVVNNMFYNYGHRFIYDERTLVAALERAGFTAIVGGETEKSDDAHFHAVDQHWKLIGREFNDLESMVFEGTRP